MSDNEKAQSGASQTQWGIIIRDMMIIVAVMGTIAFGFKVVMRPFERVYPLEELVSVIGRGDVHEGQDEKFLESLEKFEEKIPGFINLKDDNGRTLMMWTVYTNFNSPIKSAAKDVARSYYVKTILQQPGYVLNEVDNDGFTALHWAAWSGLPYSTALLIEAGADVLHYDAEHYPNTPTPLELAAMRGNDSVVLIMLQHMRHLQANTPTALSPGFAAVVSNALTRAQKASHDYTARGSWFYKLLYSAERMKSYTNTCTLLSNYEGQAALSVSDILKSASAAAEDAAQKEAKESSQEHEQIADEEQQEHAATESAEQTKTSAAEAEVAPEPAH